MFDTKLIKPIIKSPISVVRSAVKKVISKNQELYLLQTKSGDIKFIGGGSYVKGIYKLKIFMKKHYNNQKIFVYATRAAPGRISVLKAYENPVGFTREKLIVPLVEDVKPITK